MPRYVVQIPITGYVTFEMESETEPDFDAAVEYHAENILNTDDDDLTWEYSDDLRGQGNVAASHPCAEFSVELRPEPTEVDDA